MPFPSVLVTDLFKGYRGGRDRLFRLLLLRLWSRPLHRLHLLPSSLQAVRNLHSVRFTIPKPRPVKQPSSSFTQIPHLAEFHRHISIAANNMQAPILRGGSCASPPGEAAGSRTGRKHRVAGHCAPRLWTSLVQASQQRGAATAAVRRSAQHQHHEHMSGPFAGVPGLYNHSALSHLVACAHEMNLCTSLCTPYNCLIHPFSEGRHRPVREFISSAQMQGEQ